MITKDDFKTPAWQRVTEHLQTLLDKARQQNDKHLSAEGNRRTARPYLSLKELLNLPDR